MYQLLIVALHFFGVAVKKSIGTEVYIPDFLGVVGLIPTKSCTCFSTLIGLQTNVGLYVMVSYNHVGNSCEVVQMSIYSFTVSCVVYLENGNYN